MGEEKSRYAEVIVRIAPSRNQTSDELVVAVPLTTDKAGTRSYDAIIYADIELPGLQTTNDFSPYEAKELRGFPLRGVEQVVVCWASYREYRASFTRGELAAHRKLWERLTGGGADDTATLKNLRSKLFGQPSQGLKSLLSGEVATDRPLRIWWSSAIPDLVDLPWELLAYEGHRQAKGNFSFVRGVPSRTPIPRIPVTGSLKLAFIDAGVRTPDALYAALKDLPGVAVTRMEEPPRRALQRAIREGFELVHMVADGSVSHSYECVLYLSSSTQLQQQRSSPLMRRILRLALGAAVRLRTILGNNLINRMNDYIYEELDIETCSSGELSVLFNGSRVAILSLTAPKTSDDDPNRLDGTLLPSIYRVFATLGNSPLPLPNIVAPLGPLTDEQLTQFWREFYTRLAEPSSYSVEEALEYAQGGDLTAPIALFLRQRLGREFARPTPEKPAPTKEPTLINSELQAARELIEQLQAIDSKYEGLADKISDTDVIAREQTRQGHLERELSRWTQLEKGEQ